MTQFSLFGAEAAAPAPADLDGLLIAGGRWVRSAVGARLSVVVANRWRADALITAFAERNVDGPDAVVDAATGYGVRTAFTPDLVEHAARWTRGASQGLPAQFRLGPGGLRLWAIAAGRRDDVGYLLATPNADDPIHQSAGAQLSRLGVAAVSLAQRGGPGWRVTSVRRLRRLGELLGPPPPGAVDDWPDLVHRTALA
ncbi:MAG: hypothetical protein M3Y06_08650 [Actinomycetota bacterium]|nr:hypothetical protein [Actinomycetota bacterium]